MAHSLGAAAPDLQAIKARQQATWASGDFSVVASRIVLVAEQLCDTADLHAGRHVLDVATGSGNAAIAAARCGCSAVGIDYVPALLERGRLRAAAERLPVELLDGDAEALPFADASFDAVTSVFGTMFAPDHQQTANELLRVCRPGGTIALASWAPDGLDLPPDDGLSRLPAARAQPQPGSQRREVRAEIVHLVPLRVDERPVREDDGLRGLDPVEQRVREVAERPRRLVRVAGRVRDLEPLEQRRPVVERELHPERADVDRACARVRSSPSRAARPSARSPQSSAGSKSSASIASCGKPL